MLFRSVAPSRGLVFRSAGSDIRFVAMILGPES
jgi:hypothetical protein